MRTFRIQFDEAKNIANQRKHKGISLADAEPVFYDEAALTIQDHDHDEERWVTIGTDAKGRILVVAYTYRDPHSCALSAPGLPQEMNGASTWRLEP